MVGGSIFLLFLRLGMATIVIENSQPEKILRHAVLADPSAFYVGEDKQLPLDLLH